MKVFKAIEVPYAVIPTVKLLEQVQYVVLEDNGE